MSCFACFCKKPEPRVLFDKREKCRRDKSVLIVDDNMVNREVHELLVKRSLGSDCPRIYTANSGQQCLDMIDGTKDIDTVFMDYRMPGMNGREAAIALRRRGFDGAIVLCSAFCGKEDEIDADMFDMYLHKPIGKGDIREMFD